MRMLSMRISALRVCSACASVPYVHAQHALKGPFQIWNFYAYAELMRILRVCIISWLVCLANASVPDPYAQGAHQFLMRMLSMFWRECAMCTHYYLSRMLSARLVPYSYAQRTHQFLTCMLSARISFWRACSVHASIPYTHAGGIQNERLKNRKTDVHAEHARKELMRMLRVRISSWRACSGCASVPDLYAQCAHKGWSMGIRNSIFLIILYYLKHWKF